MHLLKCLFFCVPIWSSTTFCICVNFIKIHAHWLLHTPHNENIYIILFSKTATLILLFEYLNKFQFTFVLFSVFTGKYIRYHKHIYQHSKRPIRYSKSMTMALAFVLSSMGWSKHDFSLEKQLHLNFDQQSRMFARAQTCAWYRIGNYDQVAVFVYRRVEIYTTQRLTSFSENKKSAIRNSE